jgi:hypothetical protein
MKSKLLQKKGYDVNQSREVVDGQKERIEGSSMRWSGHETPHNPVNPSFDPGTRKDFHSLPKHSCRRARS